MNIEQKPAIPAKPESSDLSFEKVSRRENTISYIFKNVVVTIDNTGKNYKPLPELIFGTFDEEPNEHMLDKPDKKREGVDMGYISRCINEVVKDSGIHKFWIYPFGDDSPDDKEARSQARARVFSRYMDMEPAENDFGFIVTL